MTEQSTHSDVDPHKLTPWVVLMGAHMGGDHLPSAPPVNEQPPEGLMSLSEFRDLPDLAHFYFYSVSDQKTDQQTFPGGRLRAGKVFPHGGWPQLS